MKAILNRLTQHETLESSEAEKILIGIAEGQYNHSQISAFLTVRKLKYSRFINTDLGPIISSVTYGESFHKSRAQILPRNLNIRTSQPLSRGGSGYETIPPTLY